MLEKIKTLIEKGKMAWTIVLNLISDLRDIWAGLKTDVERLKSEKSQK